jgi:hypothetical protein
MNVYKFRFKIWDTEEEEYGLVIAENYSDAAKRIEMIVDNDINDIDSLCLEYVGEANDSLVFFAHKNVNLNDIIENIDF